MIELDDIITTYDRIAYSFLASNIVRKYARNQLNELLEQVVKEQQEHYQTEREAIEAEMNQIAHIDANYYARKADQNKMQSDMYKRFFNDLRKEKEMERTKKGKNLKFISRIKRDGSGTEPVSDAELKHVQNKNFTMSSLSISKQTWIASGFNSYVVKLKL